MSQVKCGQGVHVWHVRNAGDKIDSRDLRAGHVCACGEVKIYRRFCACGSSHKRIDTISNVNRYEVSREK